MASCPNASTGTAEPARREVAAQVGEADAVEDRRREAGGAADELAVRRSPRHTPSTTSTPAKPRARPAARSRVGRSSGSVSSTTMQHEERRRSVPDAREHRRHVLLAEREQRERRAVDEHGGDAEMRPGADIAREAAALREQHGRQREQAEEHAPERDLHRREAAVPELDQHERHAPDRAQEHEAGGPDSQPALTPRERSSSSSDALGLEAAAVAGERSVRADHAVARDQDRDRVAPLAAPAARIAVGRPMRAASSA